MTTPSDHDTTPTAPGSGAVPGPAGTPGPAPEPDPAAIPTQRVPTTAADATQPVPTPSDATQHVPTSADATQVVPEPEPEAARTQPIPVGTVAAPTEPIPVDPPIVPSMGNPGIPPGPGGVPGLPGQARSAATVPTAVVGTYPEYALAQQAVDHLSDEKFPVERTAIIGTDLRLVENVLGRLTTTRAAGAGAASGAWFGLFVGLLFGLFSNSNWFAVIFVCLLIGAAWGAIFGAIAHAATGGRRDFASRSSLQAGQYAVVTDPEVADQARQLLIQLNWRASGAQ